MLLIEDIKKCIEKAWLSIDGGDGHWTNETFLALEELGEKEYKFEVRYTNKSKGKSEWLWDMVWMKRLVNEGKTLCNLELVVESEWTYGNIIFDFEKLLVAKSPVCLMIFQAKNEDEFRKKAGELQEISKSSDVEKGVVFLLACWLWKEEKKPIFETWTI